MQVQSGSSAQLALQPSPAVVPPSSQYPEVGSITKPSPHVSVQILAVEESPNVQVHLDSTAQVESHPSPATVFPSSQYPAVGSITIPSPHVSVQELAVEESPNVQVQPVSTAHDPSHPSPAVVPESSQYPAIGFMTAPSPQISVHTEAVEESPNVQDQLASTLQLELHPSPSVVPLSSQYPAVGTITIPSPQISLHALAVEESPKVHSYPVSTAQDPSHPSPTVVPESSQYPAIGFMTAPSPQISVHTEAVEESPNVQDQFDSTLQVELHPSPFAVPLSSQYPAVGTITIPSPHISLHELAVEESPKVHSYPISTAQVELHPSLSAAFESSQ